MVNTKKNILYIISMLDTVSGPVKSLYLLASELSKRNHQVHVAFYTGKNDNAVQIFKDQNVNVIDLRSNHNKSNFMNKLQFTYKLNQIVRKKNIDIVHSHSWDADWYGYLSTLFNNTKFILTIHNLSHFTWSKSHLFRFKHYITPKATQIICVCQYLKNNMLKYVPKSSNKVTVIYNVPDAIFFEKNDQNNHESIRRKFGIDTEDFVIGRIGNVSWIKGISFFLESLTQLSIPNLKVIMVGGMEDNDKAQIQDYIKDKNLTSQVILAGFRSEVPAILDAIDVFIHSSLEEADPWAISEAMAKNKAIIATDVGGISEKISDNSLGILIPSSDSKALAHAISELYNSPSKRKEMGDNAKKHILDNFSFNQMIEQHEKVYFSS